MKARIGMYHYCRRGNGWGVYIYTFVTDTGSTASKVTSFCTKEEASNYVYQMNGWNK